ncbi:MAG TPA: mobile mystery protein A [Chitinophagales bacterium]|nr:mobile mystery protein A [Chitinophagales bacterium]
MNTRRLKIEQLNNKLKSYLVIGATPLPSIGWLKTIRSSIGMSLEQLGEQLGITKQGALNLERREATGAITIKALREAGKAMDMKLVYGFVPNDGSIDELIERKAKELATEIVLRTSGTMKLENQENSSERIQKAINERTKEIIDEMPKMLWD